MTGDNLDETRLESDGAGKGAAPAGGRPVSAGRYRLGVLLGQGGMATVVQAEDAHLRRSVAIKRLRPELAGNEITRARFFAEAEIMAALDHPGLIPVHDAGVLDTGEPFYAMAPVHGKTLTALMAGDPGIGLRVSMPLVDIFQRVCETMAFAHARGVIHRDLKPDNVMVDDFGAVYVMDWGVAKRRADPEDVQQTRAGVLMGTPAYLSPEVARGEAREADPRSDVFALGIILYEILTGTRPFGGGTVQEIVRQVLEHAPSEPRQLHRQVPRELSAICMKALAKNPSDRYHTARELAEDVRNYRSFLPVSVAQPRWHERARNWMRRHPRHATAAVSIAAALLVAGVIAGVGAAYDHVTMEWGWQEYEAGQASMQAAEAELAATRAGLAGMAPGPERLLAEYRVAGLEDELEIRRTQIRSQLAMLLGLSFFRPDARVMAVLSERFRTEVRLAEERGDHVYLRALAASRLAMLETLGTRMTLPPEEIGYVRATLDRAEQEIARRVREGRAPGE